MAYTRYSKSHPPLPVMVAAYLGIKPAAEESRKDPEAHYAELMGQLTGMK
jgi:hypothetical protein